MARSYKRAWVKDKCRFNQKLASRLLRRHRLDWDVADGMAYKRYWEAWSITDWCFEVKHPDGYDRYRNVETELWWRWRFPDQYQKEIRDYIAHTGNRRAHRLRLRSPHHKGYCNEDQTDYTDHKASKAWATDVERGSEA